MHHSLCPAWLGAGVLAMALLANTCQAAAVNVHVYGMVPAPDSTANDFHIEVTINEPFVLGAPINFHNGPFATDGVFSPSSSGFAVHWSGAAFTGGGPYDFQFDFTVNQDFTGLAYWTLNGTPINNVAPGVLIFEVTPIAEPSPLALLVAAGALMWAQRRRAATAP